MTFEHGCAELVRSGVDLNMRQMAVLAYVARRPRQSTGQIAEAVGINKPAVTRALDRLDQDGLADRVLDLQDRRKVVVTATTKGVQLLARLGVTL